MPSQDRAGRGRTGASTTRTERGGICRRLARATGLAIEVLSPGGDVLCRTEEGEGRPADGPSREISSGRVRVGVPTPADRARAAATADLAVDLLSSAGSTGKRELTEVARRVARIGERARLFYRLHDELSDAIGPEDIAGILLDRVLEVVPARRASVMLEGDRQGTLEIVASRGIPESIRSRTVRTGEWIAGRVFRQGEPILVKDVGEVPEIPLLEGARFETSSFMSIPIPTDAEDSSHARPALGVINVADHVEGRPFDHADLDIVREVADQAARVLQHVILRRRHEKQARKLRTVVRKLRKNERLSSIGELAAAVIHEIKSPLASIRGHAQMIRDEGDGEESDPDRLRTFSRQIEEGVRRIRAIADDLLSYAGKVGERMEVDLRTMVEEALLFLRHRTSRMPDLEIEARFADEVPHPHLDRASVQMVVQNLIANAADAIDEAGGEGSITIRVGEVAPDDLPDRLAPEPEEDGPSDDRGPSWTRVQVRDTGPGVEPSIRGQLFDSLFTTKSDGTGLGLPLSRQIARNHGGDLVLDEGGDGAVFSLYLPVEPEPEAGRSLTAGAFTDLPGAVALIDDEGDVVQVSRAFESIVDVAEGEAIGRPIDEVAGLDRGELADASGGGVVGGRGGLFHVAPLGPGTRLVVAVAGHAGGSREAVEEAAIRSALELTDGNKAEAARRLGIGKSTLYRKLDRIRES